MTESPVTRLPLVIDALLELLPSFMPSGVEVQDGEPFPNSPADEALLIAPADPDIPGVEVNFTKSPGLGDRVVESMSIAMVARSYSGDANMSKRRQRCGDMMSGVREMIREHPTRPRAWDRIQLGEFSLWHPVYTDAGTNCYAGFSIVVEALLT